MIQVLSGYGRAVVGSVMFVAWSTGGNCPGGAGTNTSGMGGSAGSSDTGACTSPPPVAGKTFFSMPSCDLKGSDPSPDGPSCDKDGWFCCYASRGAHGVGCNADHSRGGVICPDGTMKTNFGCYK